MRLAGCEASWMWGKLVGRLTRWEASWLGGYLQLFNKPGTKCQASEKTEWERERESEREKERERD